MVGLIISKVKSMVLRLESVIPDNIMDPLSPAELAPKSILVSVILCVTSTPAVFPLIKLDFA